METMNDGNDSVQTNGDGQEDNSPAIKAYTPSMPKGGGAIKGIGETFKPNAFSGTGSFSVPFAVTPARGFEPELSLDYNSGSGNGPFGMGFSLSLPRISVRTEKGIPRYRGHDTYIGPGGGTLTPKLEKENGKWVKDSRTEPGEDNSTWQVDEYLPRVEGAFSKIQQWTCLAPGASGNTAGVSYWKVTSRDNITSIYGGDSQSRISNPADDTQTSSWLIRQSIDAKGNKIQFLYKEENDLNVPDEIYEVNRTITANRYIHRILYGNYIDTENENSEEKYAFEVEFGYGGTPWPCRRDPFSSFRTGFEIRTLRLCHTISMIHHFKPELGEESLTLRQMTLNYSAPDTYNKLSLLESIDTTGFRKEKSGNIISQSLPRLALEFSRFNPPTAPGFRRLKLGADGENIPGYLNQAQFMPIDLEGEGLPGFLYSNRETTLYLPPLGEGRYAPPQSPPSFPVDRDIQQGLASLQDLDGNGSLDLVVDGPGPGKKGSYSQRQDGSWGDFTPFLSYPTDAANPRMERTGLVGNGKQDLVLVESSGLRTHFSEGEKGYGPAHQVEKEPGFPAQIPGYRSEVVTFADMFGDGLSHRVRVTSGSVECWPNLGYGRFGKKISLGHAPALEDHLDDTRLLFADIDGSGTIDLAYIYPDRVLVYLNRSGNSFSEPITVMLPDTYGSLDQIRFMDVNGNGTSCLVFTKIEPEPRQYYYDFIAETTLADGTVQEALKPYLLTAVDNNMGAITTVQYAASTKFYLQDKYTGRPWVTRLPFPVQVVEKTVTLDRLSGSRTTAAYKYHDGYYDPVEKQFRGFGYVEAWDGETFEQYEESASNPGFPVERLNKELYVPPVYTRTWYNTGAYIESGAIGKQYEQEYYRGDSHAYDMPPSVFGAGIYDGDSETVRQAYAALEGQVIRTEVYGLDQGDQPGAPYTVEEFNVEVRLVQPREEQKYAVFMVNPHESISYQYDQNPDDPRIQQGFTLSIDPESGEVEESCAVFLKRRAQEGVEEQEQIKATFTTADYIDTPDDSPYRWRGVNYQQQGFQVFGLIPDSGEYFSYDGLSSQAKTAQQTVVPYEAPLEQGVSLQVRQLAWSRSLFWNQAQDEALSPGQISSRGLVHHVENAVFTSALMQEVFAGKLSEQDMFDQGGFVLEDGYWWNKGLVQYNYKEPSQFYLPYMTWNPYAPSAIWPPDSSLPTPSALAPLTAVDYDSPYYFAPVVVTQYLDGAVSDTTAISVDYQAMQPYQMVDINNNVSQVMFDPLGAVAVSSLFGSEGEEYVGGMRLYEYGGLPPEYTPRTSAGFNHVLANPEYYLQGAVEYFYYDTLAWQKGCESGNCQPVNAISLKRDNYYHTPEGVTTFSRNTAIAYNDGGGRDLEKKLKVDAPGNWQVSGRTVYNNKGKPCQQFLPFFSDTPYYEDQREVVDEKEVQPPTITHYDPLLRVVRVDTPKGFFSRNLYSPWQVAAYDEDDTVTESAYYKEFMAEWNKDPEHTQRQIDEKDAMDKAAKFVDTPSTSVMDNQGFMILEIADNGGGEDGLLTSRYRVDIQGRVLESVDPRLYRSNLSEGTHYYNFKYMYLMGEQEPLYSDSVDAGINRTFKNIFGNPALSWNARDFNTMVAYDAFQRTAKVEVAGSVVETAVYGESLPKEESQFYNLRGQAIKTNDQAGTQEISLYGIGGKALSSSRRLTVDYQGVIDWSDPSSVAMEPESYSFVFVYDALGRLLSETAPDGSKTVNSYDLGGSLYSITVNTSGNQLLDAVKQIHYDANGQRTRVKYGSGVTTTYTYEDSTQRLYNIYSFRQAEEPDDRKLQNLIYTYDPVGNITRLRDTTYENVFCNNQEVVPLSGYTYDAIYRLIKAEGRQHPGIGKDTHINGFKQSKFGYLCPADPNDYTRLQNYWEDYTYDDSGNLVLKRHHTGSTDGSWSQAAPVEDNSNRLKDRAYDDAGNLRDLELNNSVSLAWNFRNRLVSTGIIEREGGIDDADYFNYDSAGTRLRKVIRRLAHGGEVTQVEEKIYLGNFEVKRIKSVTPGSEITILDRNTLRVMDNDTCVLILHHWLIDDLKREAPAAGTWKQRYQLNNLLGSVALEVDQDAAVISYEEYTPYGGTAIIAGNDIKEVKLKDYRYSGKERDDTTGLYYYGARYYVPWLGRWLNPDPSGASDGLNLYMFVGDNPVSKLDPDGKMGFWASVAGSVATLGIGAAGALKAGHILGTASAIAVGVTAGAVGMAVGSAIMGAGAAGIATAAVLGAGSALVGAVAGGIAGRSAMGADTSKSIPGSRATELAARGTLASGATGFILGAGISGFSQGTLLSGSAMIGGLAGMGSAIIAAGSYIGFVQPRRDIPDIKMVPVELTDSEKIRPAVPPEEVRGKLRDDRMLLVLGPQDEAMTRYDKNFKGKENTIFKENPKGDSGKSMHVVVVHGSRGYVFVPTGAGGKAMRPISIENLANYVNDKLKGFGDKAPIKFISCFGGECGIRPNAQVLANITGREVYAFTGSKNPSYGGPWKRYTPSTG
jgi:RHS repeat-associated protein